VVAKYLGKSLQIKSALLAQPPLAVTVNTMFLGFWKTATTFSS
jgi:hypothetical protein